MKTAVDLSSVSTFAVSLASGSVRFGVLSFSHSVGIFFLTSIPSIAGTLPWIIGPLLVLSFLIDYVLGIASLPSPRGPFAVSVANEGVITDKLAYNIRLYYPSVKSKRSVQPPYLTYGATSAGAMAAFIHLPFFTFNHFLHTGHSLISGGPLAEGDESHPLPHKRPLVLFSHGLGGCPDVYVSMMQDLASQVPALARTHWLTLLPILAPLSPVFMLPGLLRACC